MDRDGYLTPNYGTHVQYVPTQLEVGKYLRRYHAVMCSTFGSRPRSKCPNTLLLPLLCLLLSTPSRRSPLTLPGLMVHVTFVQSSPQSLQGPPPQRFLCGGTSTWPLPNFSQLWKTRKLDSLSHHFSSRQHLLLLACLLLSVSVSDSQASTR